MKKWLVCALTALLLFAGVLPAAAQEAQYDTMMDLYGYWESGYDEAPGSRYPEYVCGVWTENNGVTLVVGVTDDAAGERGREEILSLLREDQTVEFTVQKYSYREMCAIQEEIVSQFGTDPLLQSCGIDMTGNAVVVGLNTKQGDPGPLTAEYQKKYGDRVTIELTDRDITTAIVPDVLLGAPVTLSLWKELFPFFAAALLLAAVVTVLLVRRAQRTAAAQTTAGETLPVSGQKMSRAEAERTVRERTVAPPEELLGEIKKQLDETER